MQDGRSCCRRDGHDGSIHGGATVYTKNKNNNKYPRRRVDELDQRLPAMAPHCGWLLVTIMIAHRRGARLAGGAGERLDGRDPMRALDMRCHGSGTVGLDCRLGKELCGIRVGSGA